MSLLMEALKKAERAKREHTIPHEPDSGLVQGAENFGTPDEGLSLLPKEQATARVEAGSEFPPIIAADDLPAMPVLSSVEGPVLSNVEGPDLEPSPMHAESCPELVEAAPARPQPAAENKVTEAPAMASAPPATSTGSGQAPSGRIGQEPLADRSPLEENRRISAAQQQAKTVFTAKQPARSRAWLLGGTAAAVIAGFAAIALYYYWQIASPGIASLPPGASRQAAMPAPPAAAPAETAPAPVSPPPDTPQAAPTPAALTPEQKPAPAAQPAAPVAGESQAPSTVSGQGIRIRQSSAADQLNPALGRAYQAFLAGDIDLAQQQYHKVLQQEPNNRDALLGLAAIALNRKQEGQAAAYYGRLLELDPADPDALAGLVGLQGQTDPVQSESRLKKTLAQNPQAGAVHFALGNLYALQSRWAEAQQSYFRAYGSAPNNADYAFNLAVSLDTLNQGKLALEYYQRALSLARSGPANFDQASARNRVKELLQAAN